MTTTRYLYRLRLNISLATARVALKLAIANGYRQDCLRAAVQALEGCVLNVEGEDEEAALVAMAARRATDVDRIQRIEQTKNAEDPQDHGDDGHDHDEPFDGERHRDVGGDGPDE
jgi:hypothetical protein